MARIDIKSSNTGGGGGGGNLQLLAGASMSAALTAVADTSNTTSPLKLSTTAVQVVSPLRITTSDASGFYLDAEDSATNNRFSIKRDPSSQEVTLDFASNPSGSTTLVGAIRTYRDGVNLSNAMSFIENGSVGIGTNAPNGNLEIKATNLPILAINTENTVDGGSEIHFDVAGVTRNYIFQEFIPALNVNDIAIGNGSGATAVRVGSGGELSLGAGPPGLDYPLNTRKLAVHGFGSTSATYNIYLQNSAAIALLVVRDDGSVGIGTTTPNSSALVDITSTTKGFLPPRMTDAQRAAISSPAEGLLVYNTDNHAVAYRDGTNWGYLCGALQNVTGAGGTQNILFASGNIVNLTLNASTTLTFSGHVVGTYIIQVTQGGAGSNTLTYPASVKWSGGTAPTLTTTVGKTDILTFYHDGTNFFGTYSLNY